MRQIVLRQTVVRQLAGSMRLSIGSLVICLAILSICTMHALHNLALLVQYMIWIAIEQGIVNVSHDAIHAPSPV
jgi:hypothetical protein